VAIHEIRTGLPRCACNVLRKRTIEPILGIIKSILGFRQFSIRGLKKVTGEWPLVCLAWNLKRMAGLPSAVAKKRVNRASSDKNSEFWHPRLNFIAPVGSRPTGC